MVYYYSILKDKIYAPYRNKIKIKFENNAVSQSVRNSVRSKIIANSLLSTEYLAMNFFATIIVCCGIVSNNPSVVLGGAMLAKLLGPILGVSLGLIEDDKKLLRTSLLSEIAGGVIVVLSAFIFSKLYQMSGIFLLNDELSHYAAPNFLDLLIAVISGTAGTYAAIKDKRGVGVVGVAMSITLIPSLARCGIFFSCSSFANACNAFFLFFANFVGIQFASLLVLLLFGFNLCKDDKEKKSMWSRSFISVILITSLTVILGCNLRELILTQKYQQEAQKNIAEKLKAVKGAYIAELHFQSSVHPKIVTIIRTPVELTHAQIASLDDTLPLFNNKKAELQVQTIKITELSKNTV